MKTKPFKHIEVVRLEDVANWDDYPKENPKDTYGHEGSSYSMKNITSMILDMPKIIAVVANISLCTVMQRKQVNEIFWMPWTPKKRTLPRLPRGRTLR